MADLLIHNASILTMDSERTIIPDGWMTVTGNRIDAIGAGEPPVIDAAEQIDGQGGLVTPGLISSHNHVIDALLRGGIEVDRNLLDWLINVYFTGASQYTPDDCFTAAALNLSEAIRSGITTVVDNWGVNNGDDPVRVNECAEATLEVYRASGIRMIFARMFSDTFPKPWEGLVGSLVRKVGGRIDLATLGEETEAALTRIEDLIRKHHRSANDRIHVCPSPIHAQTATPEGMLAALELARRYDTIVPIHHCEVELSGIVYPESGIGMSCTDYLHNIGFLDSRVIAAHCVWMNDRDLRLFREFDVKVAHCPSSNMFLASGAAPIPAMVAQGITVGIGTDDTNASSNVAMLKEMRHAAFLAKVSSLDAGAVTAEKVVEMATIDGARAIGLENEIGSLEPGKKADFVLFDTSGPNWYPRHNWPSVLVYQANTGDVRTVVIDGRVVLRDRELTYMDLYQEHELRAKAQRASEDIIERAGLERLRDRGWQSRSMA